MLMTSMCSLSVPISLIMIWYSFMLAFHKLIPSSNISHLRNIKVVDVSQFRNTERTLNENYSSTMSAQQLIHIHNDYFSSLSSDLCLATIWSVPSPVLGPTLFSSIVLAKLCFWSLRVEGHFMLMTARFTCPQQILTRLRLKFSHFYLI